MVVSLMLALPSGTRSIWAAIVIYTKGADLLGLPNLPSSTVKHELRPAQAETGEQSVLPSALRDASSILRAGTRRLQLWAAENKTLAA